MDGSFAAAASDVKECAAIVASFVIERVRADAGSRFIQGRRTPPLTVETSHADLKLFAERRLRRVPEGAARGLVGWANGRYRAQLFGGMPTARELLALSARGERCVSLLDDERGLQFALHDLEHLEKFFDGEHHVGQVGFFSALETALADPEWAKLEDGFDAEWRRERDRVLADMNGAALFLYCALKGRLRQACDRGGLDFRERLSLLHRLLRMPTTVAAAGDVFVSRQSPVEAAKILVAHFESCAVNHASS